MRPLVHIGFHKTASTWLQKQLFQPDMGFDPVLAQPDVDADIVTPHDLDFNPDAALAKLKAPASGLVPVVSSENLTGHPFYGGRDSAALAWRLKEVFPDATILVVIRSQRTILPSLYMQYLRRGGLLPPEQFFEKPKGVNYPGFDHTHFCYDRLITLYQSLFARVHVETQEALATTPQAFANSIYAAAGAPPRTLEPRHLKRVSPSADPSAITVLRLTNRLRRSTLNPAPALCIGTEGGAFDKAVLAAVRWMPNSRQLHRLVNKKLAPLYSESNANLSRLIGDHVDLSDYPQTASSPVFQASALATAAGPEIVL